MRIAWLALLLAFQPEVRGLVRLPTRAAAQCAVGLPPLATRSVLVAQQNDEGTPAESDGSEGSKAPAGEEADEGFNWRAVVSDPIFLVLLGATYYIATSGSD